MIGYRRYLLYLVFLSGILAAGCTPRSERELISSFENPPQEAKPVMIWQWMDGWVTKEGITHDLEAYAEAGLAGVQNFQVGGPEQTEFQYEKNPIASAEWKDLMRFAMQECARLGLTFGTHNCPGWSSSAYPDVTPEYAMQALVWTSTSIRVGQRNVQLAQPEANLDFYRDICVLAVPESPSPVKIADIIDITARMDSSGRLDWVPEKGRWTVLRFG
ncbi:MAG: hypothetical protein IKH93_02810 [Bacteroidales bacterium]|nr:hypothetical protein [Bacteroidales bacterium]